MCRAGLVVALLFTFLKSPGQEVLVKGVFGSDSIMIGEPVSFSLTASYPRELQVLFPDSTHNFAPYELESRTYFPTFTPGEFSYDSVVYYLTSYEVDSMQSLRMPVYVIHPGDCTALWSIPDTVFLKHLVAAVPDSVTAQQLPLKTNTEYLPVSWLFNYPILLIIAGSVILVLILVWVIFGKRIRKYYRVKRLNKNHYSFLERYEYAVQQVQTGFSALRAEAALVIWKKYMESLEGQPYTKFTSREIAGMAADEKLAAALRRIDRMVYGGMGSEPRQVFAELQNYCQAHFVKKLEEVNHG